MFKPSSTSAVLGFALLIGSLAIAPDAGAQSAQGQAEDRLLDIYASVGKGQVSEAFVKAEKLVRDHPNFQLAQLVYGDLLSARVRPLQSFGDVAVETSDGAAATLAAMREESLLRVRAQRHLPAAGTLPAQFLQLSPKQRYAIAIDTSKARLYLFENGPSGAKLVDHFYVSVGKLGVDKTLEGDQRTPLGVYFIVSNLDPKSLRDFYGAGALPINYPNPYDARAGRTGRGIWIHGSPPSQFARAPKASDGCVVMANPDLRHVIRMVEPGNTPVLIARSLQWVKPSLTDPVRLNFRAALDAWHAARSSGDQGRLRGLYTRDASSAAETPVQASQRSRLVPSPSPITDLSFFSWKAEDEIMVATFTQVARSGGPVEVRRQYWMREHGAWRIFYERVLGVQPEQRGRRARAA